MARLVFEAVAPPVREPPTSRRVERALGEGLLSLARRRERAEAAVVLGEAERKRSRTGAGLRLPKRGEALHMGCWHVRELQGV